MNPYPGDQERPRYLPAPQPPYLPQPYQPQSVQPWNYPVSDKSKTTAGLLQLLLGFFFIIGGVGRLYAGNVGLGIAQLFTGVFAWVCFWCGAGLFFIPWGFTFGAWLWFVIDGIVLLSSGGKDGQGRPLRA